MDNIPKKRGRKVGKTNNIPLPKEAPKKRGRKPNKKIVYKENPVFADDNVNINDLIIKLNNDKIDENNSLNLVINDKDDKTLSNRCSKLCWNCCHNFHKVVLGIPINYDNNVFHTIGDFCSIGCISRYVLDNYGDNIYELFPLINLYNNKINNSINKVKVSPNKLLLDIFGGDMTINEYRNNDNDNYDLKMPIIIPLNYNINKYKYNNNNISNGLKLYRKKKLENNNNISQKLKINL